MKRLKFISNNGNHNCNIVITKKRMVVVRKSDKDAINGIVKLSGFRPCLNVRIADAKAINVTGSKSKPLVKITTMIAFRISNIIYKICIMS